MKSVPQIVVIADDLTGAADAAGGIACRGLTTLLPLTSALPADCDALVLTTESRGVPSGEAVWRVQAVLARLRQAGVLAQAGLIYKKVDSTLRGHPGAELAVILEEGEFERCLAAPAFPAQGRTTRDGRQLVDGQPLEQTAFAVEAKSSDLATVLRCPEIPYAPLDLESLRGEGLRIRLAEPGPRLLIADAVTDSDLVRLAGAALGTFRLFCGSAGLMAALMEVGDWAPRAARTELPPAPQGPGLVIAGSRHARTREQIEYLRKSDTLVLEVGTGAAGEGSRFQELAEQAAAALAGGADVVLAAGPAGAGPDRPEVAGALSLLCAEVVCRCPPAFLVMTGGETAGAVCRALAVSVLQVLGEIAPGIPNGRLSGGPLSGASFVTKAGAFGRPDALAAALRFFARTNGLSSRPA